jgi:hypothetical protein
MTNIWNMPKEEYQAMRVGEGVLEDITKLGNPFDKGTINTCIVHTRQDVASIYILITHQNRLLKKIKNLLSIITIILFAFVGFYLFKAGVFDTIIREIKYMW